MIVSLIVAYTIEDRAIGYQGRLPWHLPADLARFKQITMGHTLLMGRRTFESLEGKSLPGRRIIVLSQSMRAVPAGADSLAADLIEGLRRAQYDFKDNEVFIAGGARVYAEALAADLIDRMYLTLIEAEVAADTYFPNFNPEEWEVVDTVTHPADDHNPFNFTFQTLVRDSQDLVA